MTRRIHCRSADIWNSFKDGCFVWHAFYFYWTLCQCSDQQCTKQTNCDAAL